MKIYCNPLNFGYKYQFNKQNDGSVVASREAADRLREARVDLAVMDCFGYSKKMRDFAADAISRPVILSRTIAARVLSEIV